MQRHHRNLAIDQKPKVLLAAVPGIAIFANHERWKRMKQVFHGISWWSMVDEICWNIVKIQTWKIHTLSLALFHFRPWNPRHIPRSQALHGGLSRRQKPHFLGCHMEKAHGNRFKKNYPQLQHESNHMKIIKSIIIDFGSYMISMSFHQPILVELPCLNQLQQWVMTTERCRTLKRGQTGHLGAGHTPIWNSQTRYPCEID